MSAVGSIKRFRQGVEALREQELQKSLKALNNGENSEEVLRQLSRSLANKFMHGPTARLKKAGADGRDDLLKGFQTLFDIAEENEE